MKVACFFLFQFYFCLFPLYVKEKFCMLLRLKNNIHHSGKGEFFVRPVLFIIFIISIFAAFSSTYALERPDVEFRIFQFPRNMIPRIDGCADDWEVVPVSYVVGSDQLCDTVRGNGTNLDLEDLDVSVKIGWVNGLNRLYFLYEAYDDYWNMTPSRGDIFELSVDADLSGGDYIHNSQRKEWSDNHFNHKGVHGQNYHIFTPPGEGRDWCMVWGCQPWIKEFPWSNAVYTYNFKEGESGGLILEFWITPFDYAPYDGPSRAVISKLEENAIIALSWAILDYDENSGEYEGFWNISHNTFMSVNGSMNMAFRLMPVESFLQKPLEAQWSFKVLDLKERFVAFKDLSRGNITSWLWDFGDGSSSTDQNPVHKFMKSGNFVIILTVNGPDGQAKRIKVNDVAVW